MLRVEEAKVMEVMVVAAAVVVVVAAAAAVAVAALAAGQLRPFTFRPRLRH